MFTGFFLVFVLMLGVASALRCYVGDTNSGKVATECAAGVSNCLALTSSATHATQYNCIARCPPGGSSSVTSTCCQSDLCNGLNERPATLVDRALFVIWLFLMVVVVYDAPAEAVEALRLC